MNRRRLVAIAFATGLTFAAFLGTDMALAEYAWRYQQAEAQARISGETPPWPW